MRTIALVDDHALLRNSLAKVINSFDGYEAVLEADNGRSFTQLVDKKSPPDLVLLDVNMPEMDGHETAKWIKEHLPQTKILVLSMLDHEATILKLIQAGAAGYILKDSKPKVLKEAFDYIFDKGFYSNELVSHSLMNFLKTSSMDKPQKPLLNNREITFLKLTCSELTYKQIAAEMHVSPRTIDAYRDQLFSKLDIKSRTGLVLFALREGYVTL